MLRPGEGRAVLPARPHCQQSLARCSSWSRPMPVPRLQLTAQPSIAHALHRTFFGWRGNVALTNWSAQRVLEEKEKRKVYLGVYRMCAAHQPGEERRPKAAAKNPRLRSTKQLLQSMWMNKILVSLQAWPCRQEKGGIVFIPPIVFMIMQIDSAFYNEAISNSRLEGREGAEIKKENFVRYKVWTEEQILELGSISSKNKPKHWTLWPRAPSVQEAPPFKECKLHNERSPELSFMDSRKLLQRARLWPGLRAGNN